MALFALALCAACAAAGSRLRAPAAADEAAVETLRVGTSGDYAPFSEVDASAPDGLAGFDVELVRRFAAERSARVAWVRFRWPELADDFRAGRFDVAVGGVTVRPERSALGRFTRPLAEAGAVLIVRGDDPALAGGRPNGGAPGRAGAPGAAQAGADAAALDALAARGAGLHLAVNAGGHLERVARARFRAARVRAVDENGAVPGLLARGEVDAVVSDAVEVQRWRAELPGARVLGPFTRDRKAWWVRADRPALAAALDAWLAAREADGTLSRLRAEQLGVEDAPRSAAPLAALASALRERLELMPLVAEAKRASGAPLEDPAREARVLDDAVAAAREAATTRGVAPVSDATVRTLFRIQIEAGKAVQAATLAGAPAAGPPLDLARELRPALSRLGERIAALLVELPPEPDPRAVERAAAAALDHRAVPPDLRRALSELLAAGASSP